MFPSQLAELREERPVMTADFVSNHRWLPDPELCRTRYLGPFPDFSQCLAENPDDCRYGTRVVSNVFCHHPDRRRFEKAGPS